MHEEGGDGGGTYNNILFLFFLKVKPTSLFFKKKIVQSCGVYFYSFNHLKFNPFCAHSFRTTAHYLHEVRTFRTVVPLHSILYGICTKIVRFLNTDNQLLISFMRTKRTFARFCAHIFRRGWFYLQYFYCIMRNNSYICFCN